MGRPDFVMAKAGNKMVVYHARGLHEGINRGGADKGKAPLLHVF